MNLYNKIMLYFWLVAGVLVFLVTTYMGFVEGFALWKFYYLFSAISFFMFFVRRWMVKRMQNHMKWMEEQKAKEEQ